MTAPEDRRCPHPSYTGVDQDWSPGKVWECDACGRRVRFEYDAKGSEREVVVREGQEGARGR